MSTDPIARRGFLGGALQLAGGGALLRSTNAVAGQAAPPSPGRAPMTLNNGVLRAELHPPDPQKGFYRGTRFDWSGMVGSLEFAGHRFYGPWFQRVDETVRDFIYSGEEIVVGPASAATGPAQEFTTPLGHDEAAPGGTYVKIGVGVLKKPPTGGYERFGQNPLVNTGTWSTRGGRTVHECRQQLQDPGSGYGYDYRKKVELPAGSAHMRMEHTLRNTGSKPIRTEVYNHNFLTLDRLAPGPDYTIRLPFEAQPERSPAPELLEIKGREITYRRLMKDRDTVYTGLKGFGAAPSDYDVRVEHRTAGVGVRVTCDRPLSRMAIWSIRATMSLEPFIRLDIAPNTEATWFYDYEYYRL